MSPFQAWWIDRGAGDQVLGRVRGEPARVLLLVEQRLPSTSRARPGRPVLRSKPLIRFASPIASWKSSRMNIRPVAVRVAHVVPGAGHPRDLVVAPGDPGRVVGVGDRELGVRVPPGAVVEGRDRRRCCGSCVAVEVGEQPLLIEPRRRTRAGPDQVVARRPARSLVTIASRLSKLTSVTSTPYFSAKPFLIAGPCTGPSCRSAGRRRSSGLTMPPGGRAVDGRSTVQPVSAVAARAPGSGARPRSSSASRELRSCDRLRRHHRRTRARRRAAGSAASITDRAASVRG